MRIYYRISDASNVRNRVTGADKFNSLENFLKNFHLSNFDVLTILLDNCKYETESRISSIVQGYPVSINHSRTGSEAASFKQLLDIFASCKLADHEYVYFAEDDYIYLPNARNTLDEGLMIGDYATLRLHPDKFIPPAKGGNPLLDAKGGEATRVYQGIDHFWMLTNSTGMYPATSAKIMREDLDMWYWCVNDRRASNDFETWLKLRDKGRTLVMPIPTGMSHTELESASPLIGTGLCCWEKGLHGDCEHTTTDLNAYLDKYGP